MNIFNPHKIRELRLQNNMSQKKLGKYIGVSDRGEIGSSMPSSQNHL